VAADAGGGLGLELGQAVGLGRLAGQLLLEQSLHRLHRLGEHAAIGGRGEDDAAVRRHDLARHRQRVEAGGEEVALAPLPEPHVQQDGGARQQGQSDAAGDAAEPHRRDRLESARGDENGQERCQQERGAQPEQQPALGVEVGVRPPVGVRAIHGVSTDRPTQPPHSFRRSDD
jgi:hypothetical protein